MRETRPLRPTLELCTQAAEILKAIGFIHRCTSLKSEACYYAWPGYNTLLRVAAHGGKDNKAAQRFGKVVARLTFNGGAGGTPPHVMLIADCKFEGMVAQAVGLYFVRSLPPEARQLDKADAA